MQYLPTIILYGLIFAVIYFIMIRPNIKQQRTHKTMLDNLKKGDMVVTNGGLIGKIINVENDRLLIETSSTKLLLLKSYVANIYNKK